MAALEVDGLGVRYGRVVALSDISFKVEAGQVLAILGRNGAGKSSLLNAIAGGVRASSGQVMWKGKQVTQMSADQRVRLGISLVPEGRRIFPNLTVKENLRLGGFYLQPAGFKRSLERVVELFPVLGEHAAAPAGRLSGGQQQMLAIGRALMSGSELLLLDELSLGLAPLFIDEVYARLQTLRAEGITMVLVEQQVQRALRFADEALVLNLGRIVLRDKPAALAQDQRLKDAYLGAASTG